MKSKNILNSNLNYQNPLLSIINPKTKLKQDEKKKVKKINNK